MSDIIDRLWDKEAIKYDLELAILTKLEEQK